jgi:hypothetical protein
MTTIKVTGLDPLMHALDRAGSDAPRLATKALYEEASEAFLLSQAVVPVRTGALKGSGMVHPPETHGTIAVVNITYGGTASGTVADAWHGATVGYALYVHEIPPGQASHDSPTRWKYLENPVKLYARDMANRMTARVLNMLNERF